MAVEVKRYTTALVGIFVGVALIPVVQDYIDDSNLTGATATLVGLIPFFFGLSVFLLSLKGVSI